MKTVKHKLKGATLVEVLVAMGILSIVFGLTAMMWVRMHGPKSPSQKLKMRRQVSKMLSQIAGGETTEIYEEKEGYKYYGVRNLVEGDLYLLEVEVKSGKGKPVLSRKKYVQYAED